MRRLLLLLALSCCQAVRGQAPPRIHASDPLRFDITAFGASVSNPDNTPAIQAAHDAAARSVAGTTRRATVYVPPGIYSVRSPVFSDVPCVRWLGDGQGDAQSSVIRASDQYGGPIFAVGVSRTAGRVVPDATYRPDLWNGGRAKLDSSVVTKAGQRWSIRTNGDLYGMSQASPLTHGGYSVANRSAADYWQECDYLTIEAAVEGFADGRMPLAFVGSGNGTQAPTPFVLISRGNGKYTLFVGYQTARFGPLSVVAHHFSAGEARGVVRLSCQIDLLHSSVCAWVNGTQVAVTGGEPPAGARFPEPGSAPGHNVTAFLFNAQYSSASRGNADFAIHGLSLSKTLKYANKGVGTPQTPNPQLGGSTTAGTGYLTIPGNPTGGTFTITVKGATTRPIPHNATVPQLRSALEAAVTTGNVSVARGEDWGGYWILTGTNGVDLGGAPAMCDGSNLTGCAVPDAYRYFPGVRQHAPSATVDPWNIAHLPLTEPPGTRHLAVVGNYAGAGSTGSMFLLNGRTMGDDSIVSNVTFDGLQVDGGQAYGTGVMLGHVLEIRFQDCKIRGGMWGIANLIYGANYKIYLRDCILMGFDAGFTGYWTDVKMDTVNFANNGRWAMRLVSSNADCRHLNVATTGNPQYGFCRITGGEYGGLYTFDDVKIDNEGVPYSQAFFYAERHAYTGAWLRASGIYTGLYGSVPLFLLRDVGGAGTPFGPALLVASCIANAGSGPTAAVDGPGWTGRVEWCGGKGLVNSGAFPGASTIQMLSGTGTPPGVPPAR